MVLNDLINKFSRSRAGSLVEEPQRRESVTSITTIPGPVAPAENSFPASSSPPLAKGWAFPKKNLGHLENNKFHSSSDNLMVGL